MALLLLTWVQGVAPFVAMIAVECLDVGTMIVSKAALTKGMSNFVFVVYWNSVAAIVLLPFAVFRRKRAPVCFSILCRFFPLSLIGSMAQICVFGGLKYSSPTLSSAIGNLIPLITFLLAIMMRMEKFNLKSSAGVAISLGAVVSVLGATIATLYQGPDIFMSSYHSDFHHLHSQQSNWAFAGLLFTVASFFGCNMMTLIAEFPEKLTIVFFYCFFSAIITGIFSLFMETNPNVWKLRADIELIAILYAGLGAVIRNVVHAWCLEDKGATYTVMFKPLGIVLSMVMAIAFLGETLHTGSLAGGIVIALGFYSVMWGKEKEQSMILYTGADGVESSSGKGPLLKKNHDEELHSSQWPMSAVEFSEVVLATVRKAAMTKGMSNFLHCLLELFPFAVFRARMEKLDLRSSAGIAILLGAVVSASGLRSIHSHPLPGPQNLDVFRSF